ncbi:hypothetical protein FB45DRAFT_1055678 [Roridomyces roridus]|uniref:F-box domain-containing protein n=1 Tax=Roridomyces roridus TaxID=1738132 RepID=A0AAD7C2H8_9AGAR|nr:hypothetical protein FB45DRAFT_1055678 [Roridomyces roridus]
MPSPPPDREQDSEAEYSDNDDAGDDASSVSSFSESELPGNRSIAPMPEHLTLPTELQRLILSFEREYQKAWGTYRLVSKTWKEHVECLAKTEWVRETFIDYPGETIWDPEIGKVHLSGEFAFDSLDGDTAVFKIKDCAPQFKDALIEICEQIDDSPAIEIGEIVHDVQIPEMSVDWPTLTLTCPWRPLIGRIIAEELRVDVIRAASRHETMNTMKKLKRKGDVGMDAMFGMLKSIAGGTASAYDTVRAQRLGYTDKEGDERLRDARKAISMRQLFS